MPRRVAGRPALRAIALVTAVSLTATSGGLPMCLGALAQAGAHCAMHLDGHHGDHAAASPSLRLVSPDTGQPCNADTNGHSPSGASVCPTAGPATAAPATNPLAVLNVSGAPAPDPTASLL